MTWYWDGFEDDKPLWNLGRHDLPKFLDHRAMEKQTKTITQMKSKEKEKAKIQDVTIAMGMCVKA